MSHKNLRKYLAYSRSMILSFCSCLSLLLCSVGFVMVLSGCSSLLRQKETPPAPPPVIIDQKELVSIECVLPAAAEGINPYITDPTVIETKDGKVWVAWTPKNYELLSKNLSQIEDGWDARNKTIKYLKGCILRSREKLMSDPDT